MSERTKTTNRSDMSVHNPKIYVVERMDDQWKLAEARPTLTVTSACKMAEGLAYMETYRVSEYFFSKVVVTDLTGFTDSPNAKR